MEQELVMRIMASQENKDDTSSRESSIHSLQDSDRVRLPQPAMCIQLQRTICETWQIRCPFFFFFCPTGEQWSGELPDKCPRGHDGIQAVIWDVVRGPLGCQHPTCELQISVTAWNVLEASYLSAKALRKLVLGWYVNVWAGAVSRCCIAGWLGGWRADFHRPPGGEGQSWEPALGHQEDLHGCYILLQQMAGKKAS